MGTSAQKAGVTAAGIGTRTKKAAPLEHLQLRTGGDYRAQAAAVESPRQAKTTSAQKAGVTAAGIRTRTKKAAPLELQLRTRTKCTSSRTTLCPGPHFKVQVDQEWNTKDIIY